MPARRPFGSVRQRGSYASAPASVDRAAADVIGERFFGQNGKKSRAKPKAKNLRAISAPVAPGGARRLRILRP